MGRIIRQNMQKTKSTFLMLTMILLPWVLQSQSDEYSDKQYLKNYKLAKKQVNKHIKAVKSHDKSKLMAPLNYWKQDYLATIDPKLGRPTPEVLVEVMGSNKNNNNVLKRTNPGAITAPWEQRGPNFTGGRTRALVYDPNDNQGKKVWAGGVTGGLWYNQDITSSTSKWISVSSLWANLAVTCIAFDPIDSKIMYVGTGEGFGTTASSSRGMGIFKSTDAGKTFTHLSNTSSYYYVNDLIVRNENNTSVLYAAVDILYFSGQWHGDGNTVGLFKSSNGGGSFSNVMPKVPSQNYRYSAADLELDKDNRIWIGTRVNEGNLSDNGGGRILYSDDGTNFTVAYQHTNKRSRVEIACAPGTSGTVYAVFEGNSKADTLIKTVNNGSSWSSVVKPIDADAGIPKTDFTRSQAWYDLILAVNPKNASEVIVGGIDLFISQNGGSSWKQLSKWSENSGLKSLKCSYVHADQHAIAYNSDGKQCLFGCDGGVFYTADVTNDAWNSNQAIVQRNNEYYVTQFYAGSMSQTKGSNIMIAGAQDNGTQYFSKQGINDDFTVAGGDGGNCFISPTDDKTQVVSYVYNQFYATTNSWTSFKQILNDANSGKFINPAGWDDVNKYLFTGKDAGNIYRNLVTNDATSAETVAFGDNNSGTASCFHSVKLGNGKNRLLIGTDLGKVYYSDNATASTPSFTNISTGINAGNISSIYSENNAADTLYLTLSNYGLNNIYVSTNGGSSWSAKDGDFPNMPVWGILSNPFKKGQVMICTELGMYVTNNVFASSPSWYTSNAGVGPVKTLSLNIRKSDGVVMAATHGRGVFTSDAWIKTEPIAKFSISDTLPCNNVIVNFSDLSINDPATYSWKIVPNNGFVYTNSTDSTSKNPSIIFNLSAKYDITLTVVNPTGESSTTKSIVVNDTIPIGINISSSSLSPCVKDTVDFSLSNKFASMSSVAIVYQWYYNGAKYDTTKTIRIMPPLNDGFKVYATASSNLKCATPKIYSSNEITTRLKTITLIITEKHDTLRVTNYPGIGQVNWFRNGVKMGVGLIFHATLTGRYNAVLINSTCNGDTSNTIILNSVGITLNNLNKYGRVFPNPVKDGDFTWESKFTGEIEIFNVNGTLVKVFNVESGKSRLVDVSSLNTGLYFLRGKNNDQHLDLGAIVVE